MRLHDKALLAGSRLIAGSKLARAAIALYVLLLHGVIMALMYFSATPHTTLYQTSGSSSIPSAVAATQGIARLANSTGGDGVAAAAAAAGVEGLQKPAAVSAGAAAEGAVRSLLRAFALQQGLPHL
jgi:homeobox protein cut-like